jgi:anaerobic selenocysteine-containing dehydrogenase
MPDALIVRQSESEQVVRAICRMCHGGCGTLVTIKDGVVTDVAGDPDNPVNRGKLCSKAGAPSIEQLYHEARINTPLMRVGERGAGKWKAVSWSEAVKFIAEKMLAIREEDGAEAVAFARGVSMNNNQIVTRLANLFGTPNIASINYYCYGPRTAACTLMATGRFAARGWDVVAIPDFFNKPKCVVEWGAQKRIANDHGLIGHTPVTDAFRGKPVSIIVDPRRPAACGPGHIWLPLRPGTDGAMALGWANVIIAEELYDKEFVAKWCHGFDEYREMVAAYTPEVVARITGCDAEQIAKAARLYATTKPANMVWGTGADHIGRNAVQSNRAILALIGITGNLDAPGGNCFWPSPKLGDTERHDALPPGQAEKRIGADRFKCLTQRPTVYAHPPSLFDAILTEKPYKVRGLLVVGNNPAVCYPNTGAVTAALRKLDLLVVSEIFMTPTAALADIVLPAASNLERTEPRLYMHIKGPGGTLMDTSTRATVQVGERRSDWDFFADLARELGLGEQYGTAKTIAEEALVPFGMSWDELREKDYVTVPIAYRKYEQEGFGTPTGKFELWSTHLEEWGYPPLPIYEEPAESPVSTPALHQLYPLILNTGVRTPTYWNSNGHPLSTLRRLNPEPLLEIHPDTAKVRGLEDRAMAWVVTRHGRVRLRVRLSRRTRPDTVSVPHGWWLPDAPGPDFGIFETCSNVLLGNDPDDCDPILGSSPLKAVLCDVLADPSPGVKS